MKAKKTAHTRTSQAVSDTKPLQPPTPSESQMVKGEYPVGSIRSTPAQQCARVLMISLHVARL